VPRRVSDGPPPVIAKPVMLLCGLPSVIGPLKVLLLNDWFDDVFTVKIAPVPRLSIGWPPPEFVTAEYVASSRTGTVWSLPWRSKTCD